MSSVEIAMKRVAKPRPAASETVGRTSSRSARSVAGKRRDVDVLLAEIEASANELARGADEVLSRLA